MSSPLSFLLRRTPLPAATLFSALACTAVASAQEGPPPPPAPPSVTVHIRSDRPVSLFRREEVLEPEPAPIWDDGAFDRPAEKRPRKTRRQWVFVCDAPCDLALPIGTEVRLDGEGVRATRAFRLAGRPDERVVVTFDPSTTTSFATGVVIGGIGVAGIGVGLVALFGAFSNALLGSDGSEEVRAGLAFIGGGAVVGLVGASIFSSNLRSGASITPAYGKPAAPADSPASAPPERSPRAALGREALPLPVHAAPLMVPLWSTTF